MCSSNEFGNIFDPFFLQNSSNSSVKCETLLSLDNEVRFQSPRRVVLQRTSLPHLDQSIFSRSNNRNTNGSKNIPHTRRAIGNMPGPETPPVLFLKWALEVQDQFSSWTDGVNGSNGIGSILHKPGQLLQYP